MTMSDFFAARLIAQRSRQLRKELIALADGFRESSESWAALLRDCKRRDMRASVLAMGDGALGFWKAVREDKDFKSPFS